MTANRLPVLATAFGACMLAMVSFVLCLWLWVAAGNAVCHLFLTYLMPGFPIISLSGFVHGLIFTGLIGIYAGGVFAAFFNLWNWAVLRLFGHGRTARLPE